MHDAELSVYPLSVYELSKRFLSKWNSTLSNHIPNPSYLSAVGVFKASYLSTLRLSNQTNFRFCPRVPVYKKRQCSTAKQRFVNKGVQWLFPLCTGTPGNNPTSSFQHKLPSVHSSAKTWDQVLGPGSCQIHVSILLCGLAGKWKKVKK